MPVIETEIWKPNPERPGTIIFDSPRLAQDVFNELKAHLATIGRIPDEYFNLWMDWENGKQFPKDATLSCEVNFGGSEGIYLDISIAYKKDVYEYSRETGELGWHNRTVIERFATGKTLGESNDDLDRMNLAASSVTAAFYGYDDSVHARYVAIKHSEHEKTAKTINGDATKTAQAVNGEIRPGDWVIATPDDEYGYLIGQVIEIVKLGTPEHANETDNDTDNVHVDFYAFDYPPERVAEIEADFSDLYGEPKVFDELPIDDTIMAPDKLIRITELGHDEITRMGNLLANCEAFCACFTDVVPQNEKHAQLTERLGKNLMDYHDSLMGFGQHELIEMAGKISAMSDAYCYMTTYYEFNDSELDFYLKFKNPLGIVADMRNEIISDLDDMGFAMDTIFDQRDDYLTYCELIDDTGVTEPVAETLPEKPEQDTAKPKTLQEKLQAAGEKARVQDTHNNNKSHKREERV